MWTSIEQRHNDKMERLRFHQDCRLVVSPGYDGEVVGVGRCVRGARMCGGEGMSRRA